MLTPEQAQILCEANDVEALLANSAECEFLKEHNPELLIAYRALYRLAVDSS